MSFTPQIVMRSILKRWCAERLERAARDCEHYARILNNGDPQALELERAYWRKRAQALRVAAIIQGSAR